MLLSILIPTYNRSKFLLKNLELISEHIKSINSFGGIEIIISNNASPDDTDDLCKEFIKKESQLKIEYFNQNENIGLEANALFVLKKSMSEYIMYLGDDDYLGLEYLDGVLKHITTNKKTFSIIPNYVPVDILGKQIGPGRDDGLKNRVYQAGFNNCLKNSWRGHQLSGLVLKRGDLYNKYLDLNVGNIYLFIFLLAYSCLRGDTYHFTSNPIRVTQPGQENKDWGYGKDGLLNEVFDNYVKLPINIFKITILQLYFYYKQPWRLFNYLNKGNLVFLKSFMSICISKNTTFFFKVFFPILVSLQCLKRFLKNK